MLHLDELLKAKQKKLIKIKIRNLEYLKNENWKNASKPGDIIEVSLEYIEGKGVLGFTRNGEFLGNMAEDLPSPLYPVVALHSNAKVSLSN